jgi:hypothetical protein
MVPHQLMQQISHPSREQGVHPRTGTCHSEHKQPSRRGRRPRPQCRLLLGQQEDHQAILAELSLNQQRCCDLENIQEYIKEISHYVWGKKVKLHINYLFKQLLLFAYESEQFTGRNLVMKYSCLWSVFEGFNLINLISQMFYLRMCILDATNILTCLLIQLPEKYNENFNVSSEAFCWEVSD